MCVCVCVCVFVYIHMVYMFNLLRFFLHRRPCLMPSGDFGAWEIARPILEAIAARVPENGTPELGGSGVSVNGASGLRDSGVNGGGSDVDLGGSAVNTPGLGVCGVNGGSDADTADQTSPAVSTPVGSNVAHYGGNGRGANGSNGSNGSHKVDTST